MFTDSVKSQLALNILMVLLQAHDQLGAQLKDEQSDSAQLISDSQASRADADKLRIKSQDLEQQVKQLLRLPNQVQASDSVNAVCKYATHCNYLYMGALLW